MDIHLKNIRKLKYVTVNKLYQIRTDRAVWDGNISNSIFNFNYIFERDRQNTLSDSGRSVFMFWSGLSFINYIMDTGEGYMKMSIYKPRIGPLILTDLCGQLLFSILAVYASISNFQRIAKFWDNCYHTDLLCYVEAMTYA